MEIYDITKFGAVGDSTTDNSIAIQKAIDTCSHNGGGMVRVPGNGVYMTGPFNLKSNVNLYVESSAIILANPDETVYTKSAFKENFGEGSIWIGGQDAENVTISGKGTINGNGIAFMGKEEKAAYALKEFYKVDPRPHLCTLINFKNLVIKDVTFKDAAYWCLHLVGCRDVFIHGIRILNNLKIRNSDGIDLDHSKNVRISDCYIESGDDCICAKTRREYEEYGPTENVVIANCILKSTSCSIKLGSENMDAIRNVVFSNCVIQSSNRGIGIQNRDEGIVENVLFENMVIEGRLFDDVWWGKAEPIYITAYKRQAANTKDANWRFAEGQSEGKVGYVKDIFFSNVLCKSENGVFIGCEPNKIKNIVLNNIKLEIGIKTKYQGGRYDLRPSDAEEIKETATAGYYFENVSDITMKDCSIQWGEKKAPWFGQAIYAANSENIKIKGFDGKAAFPGKYKDMDFKDCEHVETS